MNGVKTSSSRVIKGLGVYLSQVDYSRYPFAEEGTLLGLWLDLLGIEASSLVATGKGFVKLHFGNVGTPQIGRFGTISKVQPTCQISVTWKSPLLLANGLTPASPS
jgi:hypothetical protein